MGGKAGPDQMPRPCPPRQGVPTPPEVLEAADRRRTAAPRPHSPTLSGVAPRARVSSFDRPVSGGSVGHLSLERPFEGHAPLKDGTEEHDKLENFTLQRQQRAEGQRTLGAHRLLPSHNAPKARPHVGRQSELDRQAVEAPDSIHRTCNDQRCGSQSSVLASSIVQSQDEKNASVIYGAARNPGPPHAASESDVLERTAPWCCNDEVSPHPTSGTSPGGHLHNCTSRVPRPPLLSVHTAEWASREESPLSTARRDELPPDPRSSLETAAGGRVPAASRSHQHDDASPRTPPPPMTLRPGSHAMSTSSQAPGRWRPRSDLSRSSTLHKSRRELLRERQRLVCEQEGLLRRLAELARERDIVIGATARTTIPSRSK